MVEYNYLLLLLILGPLSSHGSDYSERVIGYLFTAIQRRERIREREGALKLKGGGGSEPNKTTAKKNGPLPILYVPDFGIQEYS
jgi:hypothetical protein